MFSRNAQQSTTEIRVPIRAANGSLFLPSPWNGLIEASRHDGFCYREHEAYRKFHSADCMKDINDLVNVRAGELECSRKTTEYECRAADRCSW